MRSLAIRRYRSEPPGFYGTPKEVWGFRVPRAVGTPVAVARRFNADNAELFGLHGVRGQLQAPRVIHSLGATHVVLGQRHLGRRIHRAYVTVHTGRDGRIYMAKNRAVPARFLPAKGHFVVKPSRAIRSARRALRGRSGVHVMGKVEEMWFPRRTRLHPALERLATAASSTCARSPRSCRWFSSSVQVGSPEAAEAPAPTGSVPSVARVASTSSHRSASHARIVAA